MHGLRAYRPPEIREEARFKINGCFRIAKLCEMGYLAGCPCVKRSGANLRDMGTDFSMNAAA